MHRKHFWQKVSPAIIAVAVLSTAAAASSERAAAINQPMLLAQAGTTGGTIGKQDKSASGGEVPARARRAPVARKHHVAARVRRVPARQHHVSKAAARATRCPNIVGVWNSWASFLFGPADTTFYKGTWTHKSGQHAKWWCEGGEIRSQKPGEGVERLIVSRDGKRITHSDGNVIFSR